MERLRHACLAMVELVVVALTVAAAVGSTFAEIDCDGDGSIDYGPSSGTSPWRLTLTSTAIPAASAVAASAGAPVHLVLAWERRAGMGTPYFPPQMSTAWTPRSPTPDLAVPQRCHRAPPRRAPATCLARRALGLRVFVSRCEGLNWEDTNKLDRAVDPCELC